MQQEILIIDDSTAIHALLKARLRDEPANLHFASGGDLGFQMALQIVPDLILLDVEMPAPNGFEVCRRIKSEETLRNIPVIFLMGAASSEERIRGLEMGASDYITKPFDPAELRARVRASLRMKFMIDLLAKKAQLDALTGLWNRTHLDQRLAQEQSLARRAARPLTLLLLDIDQFETINNRWGHPVGDELLRQMASLLTSTVRAEDVVCRYDGEEFAILAPNLYTNAPDMAERIRAVVEKNRFNLGPTQANITVSVGVAASSGQADYSLIEHADAALYRAKEAGRNRVEIAGLEAIHPAAIVA